MNQEKRNIEFSATKARDFFQIFASQFDSKVEGNTFSLPAHIGDGEGIYFEVEEGLSLFVYDLKLHATSTLKRIGVSESKYFPIICWFSYEKIEQEIEGEKKLISKDSPYGIFLASPTLDFTYQVPAKSRIIILTVTITPEWLRKNIAGKNQSRLLQLLESKKPFAIYEEISFNTGQYLDKLKKLEHDDVVSNLHLRSYVLNFMALFITAVESRSKSEMITSINHLDIEKLFEVKNIITREYSKHHEIKTLATNAGMSESKLQKLFKDVFGITIYQYALKVKIEEAKRLIETKQFSISEVGYHIGYTNLSHFTTAFKKHVGINPKQYLLQIR